MEPRFFLTPEGVLGTAEAAVAEAPAGALTFTTQQELAQLVEDWPLRRLVELWNGLPAMRPVQRFEDRGIAVARLWRALQPAAQQNQAEPSHAARKRGRRTPQAPPRDNSKAARILGLLARPQGATVKEIMAATGWQAHSVRGFISGNLVKKRQLKVRSIQRDGQHAYRLRQLSRSDA
jgi:Protein of unknown function (DUF3489)